MTDHSTDRAPRPARSLAAAAGLLLAGAVALLVAWLLASWGVDHVVSTRLWRVETVVAPLVVAVGALAAAWVGASAVVAGACAVVRSSGGAWRSGETAVHRWAPGLVRRALAVAVATGVGLGTAVGAHATAVTPPPVVAADLGWTPTAESPTAVADTPAAHDEPTVNATSPTDLPTGPTTTASPPTASPGPADASPVVGTTGAAEARDAGAGAAADHPDAPDAVSPVAAGLPTPVGFTAPDQVPDGTAPAGSVVVRTGDTLWGIAARTLGPGASDAEIAAEWPRWYAANAPTIGPDPDVLLPGQVLVAPASDAGGGR